MTRFRLFLFSLLASAMQAVYPQDPPHPGHDHPSEEHSAEELADLLRASRGSISSATRTLVQTGLVQRVSRPGERRDYFRVKPGAWNELMRERMAQVYALREMAERGLNVLDAGDSGEPEARRGLEEMRDFYAYWERELPAVLERWEQQNTTI